MSILVLIYVIAERLLELVIAHGNTRRLLARGAREAGAAHYPFMVALHAGWLAAIVAWVMLTPASYSPAFLVLYGLLQVLRIWVMVSLGPYWTTRIITLADTPLVKH